MSIAALPMYDLPELHTANDALWQAIAAQVPGAPAVLTRDGRLDDIWSDPDLLLAQTCGYPLVTKLKGRVALLATPCYDAPGCDGALYRSVIVVRVTDAASSLADMRGRRCALNDPASNSGMNLLRAEVAPLAHDGAFFGEIVQTGSHANSVGAVVEGRADMAAIDCVTWAHLQNYRPAVTARLRVLGWTGATPGLPLITSVHTDAAARDGLLRALRDVVADPAHTHIHDQLRLAGMVQFPFSAYDAITALEQRAVSAGYPLLR